MKIIINHQEQDIEESVSLMDVLLQYSNGKINGTAVALNNKVIAQRDLSTTNLQANDRILIIKATQGG